MQTQPAVRLWCLGWSWACSGQGVNCAGTTWESHRALTVGAVPGPSHVGSLDLRAGGGGSSSRSSSLQQPSSSTQSESSSSQQWPSKSARRTWPAPRTYILLFRFLYKEGFPVVTQLHVEIHSVAIDLYVNLGADTVRLSSERPSSQLNKAQTPSSQAELSPEAPERPSTPCPTPRPPHVPPLRHHRRREKAWSPIFITNFKSLFSQMS